MPERLTPARLVLIRAQAEGQRYVVAGEPITTKAGRVLFDLLAHIEALEAELARTQAAADRVRTLVTSGPDQHEMIRHLLQALGEYDGARPETPQSVWGTALAHVRALREVQPA